MLHHHGRQPSSTRAVHVVLAKGASELMSIFITASMGLLSSAVAWWLETPKKLAHAPGRVVRRAGLDSLDTGSIADELAGSKDRRLDLAATPRARRPTLAHKINCVRSLPPSGRQQQERDATRGWRVSGQHASPPRCRHAAGLRRSVGGARPDCDVAVAAIVRSWLLGVSNSVQAQPLPWLAYFGLDGAHDLI